MEKKEILKHLEMMKATTATLFDGDGGILIKHAKGRTLREQIDVIFDYIKSPITPPGKYNLKYKIGEMTRNAGTIEIPKLVEYETEIMEDQPERLPKSEFEELVTLRIENKILKQTIKVLENKLEEYQTEVLSAEPPKPTEKKGWELLGEKLAETAIDMLPTLLNEGVKIVSTLASRKPEPPQNQLAQPIKPIEEPEPDPPKANPFTYKI